MLVNNDVISSIDPKIPFTIMFLSTNLNKNSLELNIRQWILSKEILKGDYLVVAKNGQINDALKLANSLKKDSAKYLIVASLLTAFLFVVVFLLNINTPFSKLFIKGTISFLLSLMLVSVYFKLFFNLNVYPLSIIKNIFEY